MVSILKSIPCDEFNVLYGMLSQIAIPMKTKETTRGDFGRHRAMTLGITRGRFNGIIGISFYSKKYPHIYKEVNRIGKLICGDDFHYDSIHVNHNVVCPKHLDSKNVGDSILVSFGEYTGCNIVIDELPYDAFCLPIKFNGSNLIHYNTNDLVGNKYSLVFYKSIYNAPNRQDLPESKDY
jgi:hypothetical protein